MGWYNNDGLYVKFGTEEGERRQGGELTCKDNGSETVYEFDIRYNDLKAAATTTFLSDSVMIPSGVLLRTATFTVHEAFDSSGEAATLTFGLYDTDRTTALDADGIDATIAEAAIATAGTVVTCDGALIGTVLSNNTPCLVTALVGTEAFTSGRGRLRLFVQTLPVA